MIGSSHIFSDQFIDKEENGKLFDVIIDFLTTDKVKQISRLFKTTDSVIYTYMISQTFWNPLRNPWFPYQGHPELCHNL